MTAAHGQGPPRQATEDGRRHRPCPVGAALGLARSGHSLKPTASSRAGSGFLLTRRESKDPGGGQGLKPFGKYEVGPEQVGSSKGHGRCSAGRALPQAWACSLTLALSPARRPPPTWYRIRPHLAGLSEPTLRFPSWGLCSHSCLCRKCPRAHPASLPARRMPTPFPARLGHRVSQEASEILHTPHPR